MKEEEKILISSLILAIIIVSVFAIIAYSIFI
jgi:hypothetical protein